jgi:hypothetical protein
MRVRIERANGEAFIAVDARALEILDGGNVRIFRLEKLGPDPERSFTIEPKGTPNGIRIVEIGAQNRTSPHE